LLQVNRGQMEREGMLPQTSNMHRLLIDSRAAPTRYAFSLWR
jgi:hypothetical protein